MSQVETLRTKIARLIDPASFAQMQSEQESVNQRVAEALTRIDPWELIFKEYGGAFGDQYERPEEKLNANSALQLEMWGWYQTKDPSFEYLIQWMLDTQGNTMVKKGNPTPENILFSRAMIAAPMLLKREARRLASLYQERLDNKNEEFDSEVTVE